MEALGGQRGLKEGKREHLSLGRERQLLWEWRAGRSKKKFSLRGGMRKGNPSSGAN